MFSSVRKRYSSWSIQANECRKTFKNKVLTKRNGYLYVYDMIA